MQIYDIISIIKDRRKELGLTQEYLANLAEIGPRTLSQIESGKANPTLETLIKILNILGMEIKIEIKKISYEAS